MFEEILTLDVPLEIGLDLMSRGDEGNKGRKGEGGVPEGVGSLDIGLRPNPADLSRLPTPLNDCNMSWASPFDMRFARNHSETLPRFAGRVGTPLEIQPLAEEVPAPGWKEGG